MQYREIYKVCKDKQAVGEIIRSVQISIADMEDAVSSINESNDVSSDIDIIKKFSFANGEYSALLEILIDLDNDAHTDIIKEYDSHVSIMAHKIKEVEKKYKTGGDDVA